MTTTAEEILTKWNREVMPDLRLIALDETRYYTIPEGYQPYIKRIEAVYLYDHNTHTHICSFTPSYWLMHVENRAIIKPETPEELREEIYEWCIGSGIGDESDYYNVSDIDHLAARFHTDPERYKEVAQMAIDGDDMEKYDTYDEYMESWREFFQQNEYL